MLKRLVFSYRGLFELQEKKYLGIKKGNRGDLGRDRQASRPSRQLISMDGKWSTAVYMSATWNRFFLLYGALFFLTLYSFRLFYSHRTIPETKNMHRHTAHIGTGNFNRDVLYSASGLTRADYAPIVDVVHPCKQQTYKSPRLNKNLVMARSISA